jgi:hypothetical protein
MRVLVFSFPLFTDCGPVGTIPFGIIKLADKYNTTFGSSGILTCDDGYETSIKNVTCEVDGVWTTAICSLKGIFKTINTS